MSDVILTNIQLWRRKCADGTITIDELREAMEAIRKERVGASTVSATAKTRTATAKAKAAPIDSNALLSELGL